MKHLTITNETQLQALLDVKYGVHLLRQFGQESTASQVAARLSDSPSRVAYHVSKLERLGFLHLVRVTGRQRFLCLSASQVDIPAPLMAALAREQRQRFLAELMTAYLASPGQETTEAISFDLLGHQPPASVRGSRVQFRSVALSCRTFERAMQAAWQVIQDAPEEPEGEVFTLALLGFRGSPLPMQKQVKHA